MKFGWKDASWIPKSVPASAVGKQLMQLYNKNGKQLTPALAAEEAKKHPNSPLGKLLEKDVRKAAEAYWREQMRYVFRHLVFYPSDPKEAAIAKEMRVFEVIYEQVDDEDSDLPNGVTGYPVFKTHSDIMGNAHDRAQVVAMAWQGLLAWRQRYRHLKEFSELFDVIDGLDAPTVSKSKRKKK
jgi:hypothetical protein